MREDIASVLARDPAAYSAWQVALLYPGLQAVWLHRLAHALWWREWRLLAHLIARTARFLTGIEIHPAAKIGRRLFIDHGMGVVIGETAEIGNDVTIYHGVTLGGVSLSHGKRHPTLADGVIVGAGAKVLGAITIGKETRIGANAVVVKDVEAHMVVVGIPGKPVERQATEQPLAHNDLPDVLAEQLQTVLERLERIEHGVRTLQDAPRTPTPPLGDVDYTI
jgi:serine O-acetyltransferase